MNLVAMGVKFQVVGWNAVPVLSISAIYAIHGSIKAPKGGTLMID